eukprot:6481387-Amphidinium_carterae.1
MAPKPSSEQFAGLKRKASRNQLQAAADQARKALQKDGEKKLNDERHEKIAKIVEELKSNGAKVDQAYRMVMSDALLPVATSDTSDPVMTPFPEEHKHLRKVPKSVVKLFLERHWRQHAASGLWDVLDKSGELMNVFLAASKSLPSDGIGPHDVQKWFDEYYQHILNRGNLLEVIGDFIDTDGKGDITQWRFESVRLGNAVVTLEDFSVTPKWSIAQNWDRDAAYLVGASGALGKIGKM